MKRFAKNVLLPLLRNTVAAGAILGLVGALMFSTQDSRASQASCIMPTSGTVSGLTLVNDINACNQSLISVWSGGSAPSGPVAGMFWFNTNTNYVQQYDGTTFNNVWFVDASNHLTTHPIGGGLVSATVPSATTTDLGSVPQSYVIVSGTTTITGFGSAATLGSIHFVKFTGVLTLTYNPTSLILPGAQNVTTQVGDILSAIYIGAGNWQVLGYTPVSVPTKASPTTSDFVLIQDAAALNAPKKSLISALLSLVGVTAIDSQVGAFTTGNGIDSPGKVIELTAARRTLPSTNIFTSGTNATYTTPAGALWLEITVVAGGGGGGGGQNSAAAGSGGASCFGTSGSACGTAIVSTSGGAGGSSLIAGSGGNGGGSGYITFGSAGSQPAVPGNGANAIGGSGGSSCRGGGAAGSNGSGTGSAAAANTGGGGGGGGATNATLSGASGGGGGGGGCITAIIPSPAATYVYTIGTGGAGNSGVTIGSVGGAGGAGASGILEVTPHFGS